MSALKVESLPTLVSIIRGRRPPCKFLRWIPGQPWQREGSRARSETVRGFHLACMLVKFGQVQDPGPNKRFASFASETGARPLVVPVEKIERFGGP